MLGLGTIICTHRARILSTWTSLISHINRKYCLWKEVAAKIWLAIHLKLCWEVFKCVSLLKSSQKNSVCNIALNWLLKFSVELLFCIFCPFFYFQSLSSLFLSASRPALLILAHWHCECLPVDSGAHRLRPLIMRVQHPPAQSSKFTGCCLNITFFSWEYVILLLRVPLCLFSSMFGP